MFKKYLLTGVTFLVVNILTSEARVISRTINRQSDLRMNWAVPHAPIDIDLNLDGTIDLRLKMFHGNLPPINGLPNPIMCSTGLGLTDGRVGFMESISIDQDQIVNGYYSGSGVPLSANTLIGPSSPFTTGTSYLREWNQITAFWNGLNSCYFENTINPSYYGSWSNTTFPGGYLGVRFTINGNIHYGYLKFEPKTYDYYYSYLQLGYTISEVAYEDIPGYPIKAGDKIGAFSDGFNATANVIRGKVYVDANNSCSYNVGEPSVPNAYIYTSTGNYSAISDNNGDYEIYVPGGTANYTLNIDTTSYLGLKYQKACGVATLTASFTGSNKILSNNNFPLKAVNCYDLSVSVSSNRMRRCFRNITNVSYENKGALAVSNAVVKVIMPAYIKAVSSTPAWSSIVGDTLIYQIPTINAFARNKIVIIDSVICADESIRGLTQCIQASIDPKTYCYQTQSWDFSDLFVSGFCNGTNYKAIATNKGVGNMSDSVTYRVILNGVKVKTRKIKLVQGASEYIDIPAGGKAVRIELDQTSGHPEVTMRSISFEGCGNFSTDEINKGEINKLPTNQTGSAWSINCLPIRDSYDPNDKQATPVGYDTDHKILPNGDVEYVIRFQNTGTDTAYTVVVADTISANLDMGSFQIISTSHPYSLRISGKNAPRLAWVFGAINLVDSTTNEPLSHGYIHYRISQKPSLANGTIIKNKAHIFFDYNSSIITNEVKHTISNTFPENLLKVTTQPVSQQLCVDNQLTLSSAGMGSGIINYLWYKDGNPLSSETSTAFSITNVASSNAGNYKCRISNQIDTTYTNIVSVSVNNNPALSITDPQPVCNTTVDITATYVDDNATTGTVSYWTNAGATASLSNPSTVASSGTYYIKKETSNGCTDIASVEVEINNCTNTLDELLSNLGVKIYPNPVVEKVVIDNQTALKVSLTDSQGKELYNSILEGGENAIDMKTLPAGLYALVLEQNGKRYMTKLMKK